MRYIGHSGCNDSASKDTNRFTWLILLNLSTILLSRINCKQQGALVLDLFLHKTSWIQYRDSRMNRYISVGHFSVTMKCSWKGDRMVACGSNARPPVALSLSFEDSTACPCTDFVGHPLQLRIKLQPSQSLSVKQVSSLQENRFTTILAHTWCRHIIPVSLSAFSVLIRTHSTHVAKESLNGNT